MLRWIWLLPTVACGGGSGEEASAAPDPVEEGCYHVAEGEIVDGSATADDAVTIPSGLDPYRVVLIPDAPTYVRVSTAAGTLVLLANVEDAFGAVDDEPLTSEPNPTCEQDILSVAQIQVSAGDHIVELNEHYKASMWVTLAMK